MKRIDALDLKILGILRETGAVTPNITYISKKLGKPVATIHGRIKRLEKKGVITDYAPIISRKKMGTEIASFILIQAPVGIDLNEYGEKLTKIKEITEVHFLVGEWSYLCKIRAIDMDDYTRLISQINQEIKPQRMEDIISPKTYKKEF